MSRGFCLAAAVLATGFKKNLLFLLLAGLKNDEEGAGREAALCRDPAVPPLPQLLACPSRPPAPRAFVLLWDNFVESSVLQVSELIVLGISGRLGEGELRLCN